MTAAETITNVQNAIGDAMAISDTHAETSTYKQVAGFLEETPLVVGLDVMSILVATIVGYIGVLVMTYGCLRALVDFIMASGKKEHKLPLIRINLGKHLALGLEFLVGKDIIESLVHPTWDDLGKLAAIIGLRTVVTIFLSRELKEVEEELDVEIKELGLQAQRASMEKI